MISLDVIEVEAARNLLKVFHSLFCSSRGYFKNTTLYNIEDYGALRDGYMSGSDFSDILRENIDQYIVCDIMVLNLQSHYPSSMAHQTCQLQKFSVYSNYFRVSQYIFTVNWYSSN